MEAIAGRTHAWLQYATVAWMVVECSVALSGAYEARSVMLLAFGSDSFVELLSASVVLLQFGRRWRIREEQAARLAGALLFLLCAVIVLVSVAALVGRSAPETSVRGLVISGLALAIMPWLAYLKRRAARQTGNRAMAADAVQSATCAYLAALTLGSLALNGIFHLPAVDSAGALLACPILLVEGSRAWKGKACGCH